MAEDFNIRLGVDTSKGYADLAAFKRHAKKQAAEIASEISRSLSIEMFDADSAIREVKKYTDAIATLKKKAGDKKVPALSDTVSIAKVVESALKPTKAKGAEGKEIKALQAKLEALVKAPVGNVSVIREIMLRAETLVKEASKKDPKVTAELNRLDAEIKSLRKERDAATSPAQATRIATKIKAAESRKQQLNEIKPSDDSLVIIQAAQKSLAQARRAFDRSVGALNEFATQLEETATGFIDGSGADLLAGLPVRSGTSGSRTNVRKEVEPRDIKTQGREIALQFLSEVSAGKREVGDKRGTVPALLAEALKSVTGGRIGQADLDKMAEAQGGIAVVLKKAGAVIEDFDDYFTALEAAIEDIADSENGPDSQEVESELSDFAEALREAIKASDEYQAYEGKVKKDRDITTATKSGMGLDSTQMSADSDKVAAEKEFNAFVLRLIKSVSFGDFGGARIGMSYDQETEMNVGGFKTRDMMEGFFPVQAEDLQDGFKFASITAEQLVEAMTIAYSAAAELNKLTAEGRRGYTPEILPTTKPGMWQPFGGGKEGKSAWEPIGASSEDAAYEIAKQQQKGRVKPVVPLFDEAKFKQDFSDILGDNPLTDAIVEMVKISTNVQLNPNSDSGAGAIQVFEKLSSTAQEFLQVIEMYAMALGKVSSSKRNTGNVFNNDFGALGLSDTNIDHGVITQLFSAANLNPKRTVTKKGSPEEVYNAGTDREMRRPAGEDRKFSYSSSELAGPGVGVKAAMYTKAHQVAQELAEQFFEIYGIEMKDAMTKSVVVNTATFRPEPAPEYGDQGTHMQEMNYLKAFVANRMGMLEDLQKGFARLKIDDITMALPDVESALVDLSTTGRNSLLGATVKDVKFIKDAFDATKGVTTPSVGATQGIGEPTGREVLRKKWGGTPASTEWNSSVDQFSEEEIRTHLYNQMNGAEFQAQLQDSARQALKRAIEERESGAGGLKKPRILDLPKGEYFDSMIGRGEDTSKQTTDGLINGLTAAEKDIQEAGYDLGDAILDGYEDAQGIQSPSKEMYIRGTYTVQGLVNALNDGSAELTEAGKKLADSFHKGFSEEDRLKAVARVQDLEKQGETTLATATRAAYSRAPEQASDKPKRRYVSDIDVQGDKPLAELISTEQEIQDRNKETLAVIRKLKKDADDLLVAFDIESTGGRGDKNKDGSPRDPMSNRPWGIGMVAGVGPGQRGPGGSPGVSSVRPSETVGIYHGMVVPPTSGGQLMSNAAAGAVGLQGADGTNRDVLTNLIKRIESRGYGPEKTAGSEAEYVRQLEDIALVMKELYTQNIPLAMHNQSLSDFTTLAKEFQRYQIEAPSAGQFRDAGLLIDTQSQAKAISGYLVTAGDKISQSVGKLYEFLTGKVMGSELVPTSGSVPKLDKGAVAHDPTIDASATLVLANSLRQIGNDNRVEQMGLNKQVVSFFEASWQDVSNATWGARKFGSPGQMGNINLESLPMWGDGTKVPPKPRPKPAEVHPMDAATDAAADATTTAAINDDLDKERERLKKEYENEMVNYSAQLALWWQSNVNKLIGWDSRTGTDEGKVITPAQQKKLDEAKKKFSELTADAAVEQAFQRLVGINGGVPSLYKIGPEPQKPQKLKEIEKQIKELEASITVPAAEVGQSRGRGRGGITPNGTSKSELLAAAKALEIVVASGVGEITKLAAKRLEAVKQSLNSGPVGRRTDRRKAADIYALPNGVQAKDRVAGAAGLETMRKGIVKQLEAARQAGKADTVEALTKLLAEIDQSKASGPVGKFNNGKDAYAVPDDVKVRIKQPTVKVSNTSEEIAAGGPYIRHANQEDQDIERGQKERRSASKQLQGELQNEMKVMAQVERYNRKMMDSWISGRYALYDMASTYENFSQRLMRVIGFMKQAVMVNAQYETSFTSVERVMQPLNDEIEGMRREIVLLTGELPVAFDELARIGTLGGQMGIKADGITQFTEEVTKFATITGLATDTVAKKFGSISQLANVPSDDFNKLGSAVAFAGISAVATDEEILTMTESIATSTTAAGFAADKTIGLATAISSLRIAPEQARGVLTRLFSKINRAMDDGGKAATAYANTLGLSVKEAQNLWETDPEQFFRKMLASVGSAKNVTSALDALNIKETREVQTLQKLAENSDVYNESIANATEAYNNGTFSAEAYAKSQDNVEAKMKLVENQFKIMQDSLGEALAPTVKLLLDGLKGVLEYVSQIANNPVGKWAVNVAGGIIGLTAAFVALRTISMKATASVLAFRTGQIAMANTGLPGGTSAIWSFIKQLTGAEVLLKDTNGRILVAQRSFVKKMEKEGSIRVHKKGDDLYDAINQGVDPNRTDAQIEDMRAMGEGRMLQRVQPDGTDRLSDLNAEKSTKTRKRKTKATADDAAATAAATAAETQNAAATAAATAAKVAAIEAEIVSKTTKLQAIAADTAARTANLGTTPREIAASNRAIAANNAETASIRAEIVALEQRKAAAAGPRDVAQLTKSGAMGKALSYGMGALGVVGAVLGIVSMVSEAIEATKINLAEAGGGLASFREAIYADTRAWKESGDAISTYDSKVTVNKTVLNDWAVGMETATGASTELKGSVTKTTDEVIEQTLALGENSQAWLAKAAMEDKNIQDMFKRFYTVDGPGLGDMAAAAGTKISDIITAALDQPGTGATAFVEKNFNIFASGLQGKGAEVRAALLKIAASLDTTTAAGLENSKMVTALAEGLQGLTGDVKGTGDEFDNVTEKIRTLTDYVGDLESILGAAFTIRYGKTEAIDKLTSAWKELKDKIKAARTEIANIQRDINGMQADANILQYQLNIAIKYGDTKRADKLRAEIAAKQGEISAKNTEMATAQGEASTSLKGNSEAAIRNRGTLRGLVTDYNTYLAALANTAKFEGMSADAVKKKKAYLKDQAKKAKDDLIAGAKALGFKTTELEEYIGSFDDFTTIIDKLPKELTLKVVADPATRAFMEWWENNKGNFDPTGGKTGTTDKTGTKGKTGTTDGTEPEADVVKPLTATDKIAKATKGLVATQKAGLKETSNESLYAKAKSANKEWSDYTAYIKKTFGTASQTEANKRFKDDPEKLAKFNKSYSKLARLSAEKRKWQVDLGEGLTDANKYNIGQSEGAKEARAAELKKQPAIAQEAFKWFKTMHPYGIDKFYAQDKAIWEKTKKPFADAKAEFGLSRDLPWAEIKKLYPDGKKARHQGQKKDLPVVATLQPYYTSFKDAWDNIKDKVARGAEYRKVLQKLYTEEQIRNFGFTLGKAITVDNTWTPDKTNQYATGGYVSGPGTGTSDSIRANLSNGEFVMRASSVRSYGLDFMNALNQQQIMPRYSMPTQPGQAGGAQIVYLSPEDRNLLRAAIDRPVNLYTENARIAQSANAGNVLLAQRGRN